MTYKGMPYQAVAFDLLTALVDSWSLWIDVAGDEAVGRAWRTASLRRVTGTGAYRSYDQIVQEAALDVGLPVERQAALAARWPTLRPWPEAPAILGTLAAAGLPLAVVTNCSQVLAEQAAARTTGAFRVVMSAERAGVYKPDRRPYAAGAEALGFEPARVLFVAGSAHDVPGASAAGMDVYWSNRQGLPSPAGSAPTFNRPDLRDLPAVLGIGAREA